MLGNASQEETHHTGIEVDAGTYECTACGVPVALDPQHELPVCPSCGGNDFRRASMFEHPTADHAIPAVEDIEEAKLAETRAGLPAGAYLALAYGGRVRTIELEPGWSRVGRSPRAAIRLDDPTVSRRHALLVNAPGEELRVLDDRSLNGISVNGERRDWSTLADGDVLGVGRYRLHVLDLR